MINTTQERKSLFDLYRKTLLDDIVPFWLGHSLDAEHGGYLFCLERDGTVADTDKPMWIHGRFVWLLSTLCLDIGNRDEWLAAAKSGIDFMERHGIDPADSRRYYSVTDDGRPLRKRRYVFTETFAIIAYAAYGRATGDDRWFKKADELLQFVLDLLANPGRLDPKVDPATRSGKALAVPMILINTAQELRRCCGDPNGTYGRLIDDCIEEVRRDFLKDEYRCVLEQVGPAGELIDHYDGRQINPGHGIELAWFILREAAERGNDPDLISLGCTILDYQWEHGWDPEHGGILYYRDAKGFSSPEYWHQMKFWWPHNEAEIATLMAFRLTGDPKYSQRFEQVHRWSFEHFPDPEYGEWFGYLDRQGTPTSMLKGNFFKGPFHLPRMLLRCSAELEAMGIS